MSKYAVKGALREVKNYTKGYSDVQAKVRSATSNDPWGPSGTVMSEIAQATHNQQEFMEIMEMIDKRLNDSGKNWRHVFKALSVLDYCIQSGSDQVVAYARDNLYIVKTLKEFQYVDDEGKDQASNVRQKAKDITSLLSDPEGLAQKRRIRNVMHDRMSGSSKNAKYPSGRSSSNDTNYTDEDRELQQAIEESRRTADEHEKKIMRASEEGSRATIQLSENEKAQKKLNQQNQPFHRKNSFDFFAGSQANQQPQQQSYDPFLSLDSGEAANNANQQKLHGVGFGGENDFGGESMNNSNPYQQKQQKQQQQQQQQQQSDGNNFNGNIQPSNHSTNPFGGGGAVFGGAFVQSPHTTNINNISSAFDGGMPAKHMPHELAGENAATRLAAIARNSAQIDPFANLASTRNAEDASRQNPFGTTAGSDTFGGVTAPFGQSLPLSAPPTFPSGLPSGIRPNLVNLDALSNTFSVNPSSSSFANSFTASAGNFTSAGNLAVVGVTGNKKYDWAAGGSGPKQQRTLAELAATSSTPPPDSPNMSGTRTGLGLGSSSGMGGVRVITGAGGINLGAGRPMPPSQQNMFGQPRVYKQASGMYGQGQVGLGMGGSLNNGGPGMGSQQGDLGSRNGTGTVFFLSRNI